MIQDQLFFQFFLLPAKLIVKFVDRRVLNFSFFAIFNWKAVLMVVDKL
jgi:hypothetical protein